MSNSPSCRGLDRKAHDGSTVLHFAARYNYVKLAQLLIQKGKANMNLQDLNLRTPVHIAADRKFYRLVRVLVHEKCNLNITDVNGYTPLHIVLRNHFVSQFLNNELGKGVGNNDSTSVCGSEHLGTCYDKNSHASLACFLVSNGADLNIKDNRGETPLEYCTPFDPNLHKVLQRCQKERVSEQSATPANATPAVDDDCNSDIDIHKLTQEQQDKLKCPVCLDHIKNVLFECGHGTCQTCSGRLLRCPICQNAIQLRAPVRKFWFL